MLVPTKRSLRIAIFLARCAATSATCFCGVPALRTANMPSCSSISWNCSQAFFAISPVIVSTYQQPPAGSTTLSKWPSSLSTIWTFRAIRLEKSLGCLKISSKGLTCMESTPPATPENASVETRSMLTQGSTWVLFQVEVRAWIFIFLDSSFPPKDSTT